jgi:hypothetical protein
MEIASPEIGWLVTAPLRMLVNTRPGSVVEPGVEGGDRVGGGVLAVHDGATWPSAYWSVLDRRTVRSTPPGLCSMSARVRAASSERRIAEA